MRHIWSVVCQHVFQDKDSNNYSLIETLGSISFKGDLPLERPFALPFRYHIVSRWHRTDDRDNSVYTVRMRLISPANVELDSTEMTVSVREHVLITTNFGSDTFQYTDNGIYEFEISYRQDEKWIVATQVPLKVTHRPPESEQHESEPD